MFRFTIRDVLWLTVVVSVVFALGTAWWLERSRANRFAQRFELNTKLLRLDEPLVLSRGTSVTIRAHEGQVALTFGE